MIAAEVAISPVFSWLLEHGWQVLVVFVLPAVKRWLDANAAQSEVAKVTKVFADAAASAVAVVDRELRPKLVAALADGKLTDAERAELQAEAISILKNSVAPDVFEQAKKHFGPLLENWLKGHVERALTVKRASDADTAARATVAAHASAHAYLGAQ